MFGDPGLGFEPPKAPEYEPIFGPDFDAYIDDYLLNGDPDLKEHRETEYTPPEPLPTPPPYEGPPEPLPTPPPYEMPEPLPTPPPYEGPPEPLPTPPPYEMPEPLPTPPPYEGPPEPLPTPPPYDGPPEPLPTPPPYDGPTPTPEPTPEPTPSGPNWGAYIDNNADLAAFYDDLDDDGSFAGGQTGSYYQTAGGQEMGSEWEQDWVDRLNKKYGTNHDDVGDFTKEQFGEAHYEYYGKKEDRQSPYEAIQMELDRRKNK